MIDRRTFFAYVRRAPFGGKLSAEQVDGMTRILDEWRRRQLTDLRWLANMLAQVTWETAHTMQPIRERGSEKYLRSKTYYPWVGEGLIQVTWERNHRRFGATKPGQLLTWPIALRALFDGMINGMFTGKKLGDYFNATTDDPVGARRIVNGTDKAKLIAEYHAQFLHALEAADTASPMPRDVPADAAQPDEAPATQSKGLWGALISMLGGSISLPVLGQVDSLYAFLAFVVVVAAVGFVVWLMASGRLKVDLLRGAT